MTTDDGQVKHAYWLGLINNFLLLDQAIIITQTAILCDLGCCELWNISSKYTDEMHTEWRIAMRKSWKLYHRTHNNLIFNIRTNVTHFLVSSK